MHHSKGRLENGKRVWMDSSQHHFLQITLPAEVFVNIEINIYFVISHNYPTCSTGHLLYPKYILSCDRCVSSHSQH